MSGHTPGPQERLENDPRLRRLGASCAFIRQMLSLIRHGTNEREAMVETIVALSQGNARIMAEAVELMQNDARPRIILDPNPNLLAACDEAIRLTTDHLADDDAPRGLDAATARNLRHICRAAIAKAGRA